MQSKMVESSAEGNMLPGVLVRLTLSLSSGKDFNKNIGKALQLIGEYSQHDRIHIIEIHENMTYTIRYEWYAKSLQPLPEDFRHRPVMYAEPLEEQLCRDNHIRIEETDNGLPEEFHAFLNGQSCHRMLLLPLFESGSQFAFIAFMQCGERHHPWETEEIRVLADFASLIACQMHHHLLTKRLFGLLREHKKAGEPYKILHTRLKKLHTDILPAWEEVKNTLHDPQSPVKISSLAHLEEQIDILDNICRTYL